MHSAKRLSTIFRNQLIFSNMSNKMSSKKILIINGHPDAESFNFALAAAYKKGALASGAEVREIVVRDLKFNLSLEAGYRHRTELEPDLLAAQKAIKWAEHLVWVYPVWWGSVPAILKGFLDRTLLPGFAFQKRENSVWWDKLLTGKSARIISTLDQPAWYFWLINGQPTNNAMKKMTLDFCGIKPVKITNIGPIRNSKDSFRQNWLAKIEKLGKDNR
jgi:NAD(P)H dehydrogenase (quinone)